MVRTLSSVFKYRFLDTPVFYRTSYFVSIIPLRPCENHWWEHTFSQRTNMRATLVRTVTLFAFMLLSHWGEYSCENVYLKFAMNSPKICDWTVNKNMFLVVPQPLLTNILHIIHTLYRQYQWLNTNYYKHRWRNTVFTTFAKIWEALRIAALTEWRMFLRRWIFELRVEFIQNGGWIVNIFMSVSPLDRPRSALSLPISNEYITNAYQRLLMPLRTLPTLTHALPTLPMLTKKDSFRNICWNLESASKLTDLRKEVLE